MFFFTNFRGVYVRIHKGCKKNNSLKQTFSLPPSLSMLYNYLLTEITFWNIFLHPLSPPTFFLFPLNLPKGRGKFKEYTSLDNSQNSNFLKLNICNIILRNDWEINLVPWIIFLSLVEAVDRRKSWLFFVDWLISIDYRILKLLHPVFKGFNGLLVCLFF